MAGGAEEVGVVVVAVAVVMEVVEVEEVPAVVVVLTKMVGRCTPPFPHNPPLPNTLIYTIKNITTSQ